LVCPLRRCCVGGMCPRHRHWGPRRVALCCVAVCLSGHDLVLLSGRTGREAPGRGLVRRGRRPG
jgi:hypothetical protein